MMRYNGGMRQRGSVLGTVIMVIGVALMAALVVSGASTFHLQASQRIVNSQTASNLAESAIHQAIAALQDDPESLPEVDLSGLAGLPDGAYARVTFNRGSSFFSTNNFKGGSPNGWNGRRVPVGKIHLVAVAGCNGVERHIETLLHLPTYPAAIAVSGQLTLKNTLVAGLGEATVAMSGGQVTYDEDDLRPGDVATNNGNPGDSLVLDVGTVVKGNAQARGGIQRLGTAVVEGEVRSPWTDFAELPDIKIADYDPRTRTDTYFDTLVPPPGGFGGLDLTGVSLVEGDLVVTGPARLDNAVLFVDGTLNLQGGLQGSGAVFVSGGANLKGGVNLQTDDSVALLAEGDVHVWGDDRLTNVFQGTVYCKSSVTIERVTLVGTFIQDSADPAKTTTVIDSNLFYSASGANPEFVWPVTLTVPNLSPDVAVTGGSNPDGTDQPISAFGKDNDGDGIGDSWNAANIFLDPPAGPGANSWASTDVCLIEILEIDNQQVFIVRSWGRDYDGNPVYNPDGSPAIGTFAYHGEAEFLQQYPNDMVYGPNGSGGYTEFTTDDIVPSPTQVRAALERTLAKVKARTGEPGSWSVYLSFDPNEFLARDETLRILMWREF